MLGIQEIGSYIPGKRVSNYERTEKFGITADFIDEKIGVKSISVRDPSEESSDLCIKAFNNLAAKTKIKKEDIDVLVVITQNPDFSLPQTSAIVHGKLDMPEKCASFDISLGCSGFVYGLSIIQSFMKENEFRTGLLFTSDPYSKIINPDDKNTSLLFGDAAAVTLISDNAKYITGKFSYGTTGKDYQDLICKDGKLIMNGRSVFNFAAKTVPKDVVCCMKLNNLTLAEIDRFVFHQGSLHIVNTIAKRLELPQEKVVFDAWDYGNTVSSSIPILLENEMNGKDNKIIFISGFGVGLSWASTILIRAK